MFFNKQLVLLLIISGFVFTAFGYWILPKIVNKTMLEKQASSCQAINDIFTAGQDLAKQRDISLGSVVKPIDINVKYVSGIVKKIDNRSLTMEITSSELANDPDLNKRTIIIDKNTKIYSMSEAALAEYRKSLAEYNQKMQTQSTDSIATERPKMQNIKDVALADIKSGTAIGVLAADDDIKKIKQFVAAEIRILPDATAASE